MDLEKVERELDPKTYREIRKAYTEIGDLKKRVGDLKTANLNLTAELLDARGRTEIAEEMVLAVLTKSVDRYLNCG